MSTISTTEPAAAHAGRAARPGPSAARVAWRITVAELRLLRREPGVLAGLIAFPAITVLVIAGVFGSAPDPEFGGVRPDEHYVVGYVGVALAQLGLVTLPVHVASRRELGVARRYRAAGVSAGALLASQAGVAAVLGVTSAAIVLLAGGAVYGLPAPDDPAAALAWLAAGLACFVAIGLALGTMLRSSRAASAVGTLLFVPMFLLGGGGPPRDVMTGVMQAISDVLPLSHLVGGLRLAWLGSTDDPSALWWPLAVAVVAGAASVRITRRRAS